MFGAAAVLSQYPSVFSLRPSFVSAEMSVIQLSCLESAIHSHFRRLAICVCKVRLYFIHQSRKLLFFILAYMILEIVVIWLDVSVGYPVNLKVE